ncbi:MAG TPA: pyridoxal-5-phosphate-dependent protein subunit beta, partial [Anaerolineales bacterium]|nr:pyridoxal-5-phosphate-dependent protein subunit beta [Anaerolineales bacterium]
VGSDLIERLPLAGISGVGNIISAIKFAKWYELGSQDVVMTVLTDSMELYNSRLIELNSARGKFTVMDAHLAYGKDIIGLTTDYMTELDYYGKKRIHNLKYFTWVEQQGKSYDEIQAQWYEDRYWHNIRQSVEPLDALIEDFNSMSGATLG